MYEPFHLVTVFFVIFDGEDLKCPLPMKMSEGMFLKFVSKLIALPPSHMYETLLLKWDWFLTYKFLF